MLPDTTVLTHWVTGLVAGLVLFVSVFLHELSHAQVALRQLLVRRALEPLAVADVMTHDVVQIAADIPVSRAVDEFLWRHHVTSFPVLAGGRVVGILSIRASVTFRASAGPRRP